MSKIHIVESHSVNILFFVLHIILSFNGKQKQMIELNFSSFIEGLTNKEINANNAQQITKFVPDTLDLFS